jgi:hypothetical protein
MSVFLKNLNISVESCHENKKKIQFQVKFNSFHESLLDINNQNWFPIYIDNKNWNTIEFVCSIELEINFLINLKNSISNDFDYVSFLFFIY